MNIAEIEGRLKDLVDQPFDPKNFVFSFIEAFEPPKATLTKLKQGSANHATLLGDLLWKKEIRDEGVARGRVYGTTYGQIIRSANARLFRLKERIPARYDEVSGADLLAKVMSRESQSELRLGDSIT